MAAINIDDVFLQICACIIDSLKWARTKPSSKNIKGKRVAIAIIR